MLQPNKFFEKFMVSTKNPKKNIFLIIRLHRKIQCFFQEKLAPLTKTTLTTTTAGGIAAPTIWEEEKVQMGPQPTAEPIQKHPRVMGPETVAVPIGSA
jgi:hypothetical protein